MPLDRANIVGIVQSPRGFVLGPDLTGVDAFEVRLDAFERMPVEIAGLPGAVIITVRDRREGGLDDLSQTERASRYLAALPFAAAIDVELACRTRQSRTLDAAREAKVKVILSQHDFQGMPAAAALRASQRRAAKAGADVFKVAVTPSTPRELAALLALLDDPPIPTAVMGMGRLGKASRIAAMACGSVLNYGWIERPNVAGQWSAAELCSFAL